MRYATRERRNSVGASHRDHPRFDYTHVHKRYDRSFATTATSIGPKWRRDSAKRDAKQVLLLSRYRARIVGRRRIVT